MSSLSIFSSWHKIQTLAKEVNDIVGLGTIHLTQRRTIYDIRGRDTYVNGTCLARKVREGIRGEARVPPHLHRTTQPHHAAGGGGDGYQERGCEVACYGRVDADDRQSGVATRAFRVCRFRCPRVRQFVRHPVQVWFARCDTGGIRRTFTCYFTRQDIPRRTAVTARKVYRDTESATTA